MDEYIELLDNDNKPNGKRILKSEAHKKGLFHATVHIWFFTKDKKVLIQKRHKTKNTFPNLWDVSVAGHISYKEKPILAALRETEEEIGLSITENQLKYIGTSTHKNIHSANLIDNELHHIYICEFNKTLSELKIQDDEVAEVLLLSINDLKLELQIKNNNYVPHGSDYYNRIFDTIEKFS